MAASFVLPALRRRRGVSKKRTSAASAAMNRYGQMRLSPTRIYRLHGLTGSHASGIIDAPSSGAFMKTSIALLAACLAVSSCARLGLDSGSAGPGATASSKDVAFMRDIAQANLAEIDTGKLAVSKAKSDAVKRFGQHMVDEHSKMMQEGSQLAAAKGVQMPTSPGLTHQAAKKRLEMGSSDNFDKAYMEQMVLEHQATLDLVKRAAANATDPSLKAHAEKAIPHVQQHLDMARNLAAETK